MTIVVHPSRQSIYTTKKNLTGFTLVELIVVITILVILGTIAFVSLDGFSGSARDSSRVSDLSLIGKGLDIHYTKLWSFPVPTSSTGITFGSSSSVVWYQGTIGEWVIRSLGWIGAKISTKPTDPLSKSEYRYSLPTGVNEYLLGADYEGDSVAYARIPLLTSPKLGEELSFSPPSVGGVGGGIFGLDFVSASTGSPTLSYLKGTYNGVATRVLSGSTINIIALPSIFLASGSTGTIVDASSRNFLLQGKSLSGIVFAPKVVYSSWALPSSDTERLLFSSGIVAAYSGTSLTTNSDIKSFIDNVNSTGSLSAIGGNFVRNKFGGNAPSVAVASASAVASYDVANSLLFNGSSQYLSRTFTSPGSGGGKSGTVSFWTKRSKLWTEQDLYFVDSPRLWIYFWWNDRLRVGNNSVDYLSTSATFLDTSVWYHIVVTFNTNDPTPANRIRVYVNGVEQTYNVTNYPGSVDVGIGQNSLAYIASDTRNSYYVNGYLSDFYLIDGVAFDPTAFAQSGATSGQWVPKAYTGGYGTNGFHLGAPYGTGTTSGGTSGVSYAGGFGGWLVVNQTQILPNGQWISSIGVNQNSAENSKNVYILKDNGDGTYTVVYKSASFNHAGSGLQQVSVDYTVPATGAYVMAVYCPGWGLQWWHDSGTSVWYKYSTTTQSVGQTFTYASSPGGGTTELPPALTYQIWGIATDASGNNNHWATNGWLSANNVVIDTPTNNFAVLNSSIKHASATVSNGNLSVSANSVGFNQPATLSMSGGKWYWEVTPNVRNYGVVGILPIAQSSTTTWWVGNIVGSYGYALEVDRGYNAATYPAYLNFGGGAVPNDTVIGVAYDADNGRLWFRRGNTWQWSGSPDPSWGASPNFSGLTWKFFPAVSDNGATGVTTFTVNFWQWGQSGLTYYSSAGWYFKYAPPTGFKAISSVNTQ